MMRHSLGAAFGAQIPEALDTAMAIQDTPDTNLLQMAKSLGVDISKYRTGSNRKRGRKRRHGNRTDPYSEIQKERANDAG